MSDADLVVVGAGILGLAVAREALRRRPGARVTVLERHAQVGAEQTMRNSGVIHAGIYYAPGSLKARMCVAGSQLMYELSLRYPVISGLPAAWGWDMPVVSGPDGLPWIGPHRSRPARRVGLRRR